MRLLRAPVSNARPQARCSALARQKPSSRVGASAALATAWPDVQQEARAGGPSTIGWEQRSSALSARQQAARPQQPRQLPQQPQQPRQPQQQPHQQPHQQHQQAEVRFECRYGCRYGERVALVGSHTAWRPEAAVPFAWGAGDVWSAVLPLPAGAEIEYKYVVVGGDGAVARWQDGPNQRLRVDAHAGGAALLHVVDSWAQDARVVREVAPRLARQPAAAGAGGAATAPPPALANNIAQFAVPLDAASAAAPGGGAPALTPAAWAQAGAIGRLPGSGVDDQHWPGDMLQRAAAEEAVAAAAAAAAAAAHEAPPPPPPPAAPARAGASGTVPSLAELLPLLRSELAAALDELAGHPEAAAGQAALLAEGRAMLAALREHEPGSSSSSGAAARAASGPRGSPRRSPPGSPGRSPSATLASDDDIAAALLSDDCEEACFCVIDAICSCADYDLTCSCEDDVDEPCAVAAADAAPAAASAAPAPAPVPVPVPVPVPAASQPQPQPRRPAQPRAAPVPVPATQLAAEQQAQLVPAQRSAPAAPAPAARPPPPVVDPRERAAAFAGVQDALERSQQALDALADPCHPLVLEADRFVAEQRRQLTYLLPA